MVICHLCQEINLYTLGAFIHGGGTHEIDRSRDQLSDDCPLCQLFLNPAGWRPGVEPAKEVVNVTIKADDDYAPEPAHLMSMAKSSLVQRYRVWLSRLGWIQYYPMSRISVVVRYNNIPYPIPMHLEVFVDQESTEKARSHVAGRAIQAANSDSNLEQVAGWLAGCLQRHSFCHTGISGRHYDDDPKTTALPDRVIDVGSPLGQPRLLETKGKTGRYVALSYCWEEPVAPGTKPFRLVRGNMSNLCERLPLSELPPTICDAIDFTRRLGISYIWIDRLCIIQEDPDDWKAQADKMCNVYEGASLTIAALAAEIRSEGLYLPREPQPSVRIRCATKDQDLGHMYFAREFDPRPGDEPSRAGTAFARELRTSRWDTRGWVLQERLMSRRVVYFGRGQLFWECQEMTYREDGIADGGEILDAGDGRPKRDLYGELARYPRPGSIMSMFVGKGGPEFWHGVIKDYTSRDLSHREDKEKAMAGIAKAINLRFGMPDYAYGVFLKYADCLLLWHWKYAGGFLKKPENPRAPSWSWMAYDGRVRILSIEAISRGIGDCSFVDSASVRSMGIITPAGVSDPVGLRVRDARVLPMLWLAETPPRAPQIDAWLRYAFENFDEQSISGLGPSLFLPKLIQKNLGNMLRERRSLDGPAPNRFTLGVDAAHPICGFVKFDLEEHSAYSSTISCLIVCEEAEKKKWWKWNREIGGRRIYHLLSLEEVRLSPDPQVPVYRRLGIAQTVWAGELGFPIHEKATSREIVLI